jgi:hypothetical protein
MEKRRVQRLKLDAPVAALVGNLSVTIVDLSTVGARIEHDFPVTAGKRLALQFALASEKISVQCDVVRCRLQRSSVSTDSSIVYNTGLRFSDPAEPARVQIRAAVAEMVSRQLRRSREGRAQLAS